MASSATRASADGHASAVPPSRARSAVVLVLFLVIAYAVAGLGATATTTNVDGWYAGAEKAAWSPPNGFFAPVWTLLYTLMAVAAWLVWRRQNTPSRLRSRALGWYVAQLVLNALWTPMFFGLYPAAGRPALWIAFVIIAALDIAIPVTALHFRSISRTAAWLLLPYGVWVAYATTLNGAVARLNT